MALSELRADRVARDLRSLCDQGLSSLELLSAAAATFDEAVPSDAFCWSTFDPATTMVTSAVGRNLDEQGAAAVRFFELEYGGAAGSSSYRALLAADRVATVVDAEGEVRDHLDDMGVGHELRVLFQHQGAGWGGAGLMRSTGAAPFTPAELEFGRRVAPIVADGVRASLVRAAAPAVPTAATAPAVESVAVEHGPAVLVVEGDELSEATPAAVRWLAELRRTDVGHGAVPAVVRAVAAHATAGRTVAQRARGADGTWVVLRGAPLGPKRAVVTIEVAGPPEVASIVSAALGLSGREIEVVTAVLRGLSTKEIATDLHLSAYTVQDHLKSVFAKAGVNSRRELVADVFFGVYAPRLGQPVGVAGFFT